MSLGADITVAALEAGLLLSRNGERLHIDSPLGLSLPEALRRRLIDHKQEVLAWLDFCAAADELLLTTWARVSRHGNTLTLAQRRAAEATLQAAHRSADLEIFAAALNEYERALCGQHHLHQSRKSEER